MARIPGLSTAWAAGEASSPPVTPSATPKVTTSRMRAAEAAVLEPLTEAERRRLMGLVSKVVNGQIDPT